MDPWHASLRAYHMAERLGLSADLIDPSELPGRDSEDGRASEQYRIWIEHKMEDICLVSERVSVFVESELILRPNVPVVHRGTTTMAVSANGF